MQQDSAFTSVTLPDNTVNGREENSNPLRFAKPSPICSPLPLLTCTRRTVNSKAVHPAVHICS